MSSPNRTAVRLLITLGAVVGLLGLAAVIAALAGDGGLTLLVIGLLAALGGAFVVLVGQGGRARLVVRDRLRAEAELDARIAATEQARNSECAHEPSACGSCGASCALAGGARS